MGDQTKMILAFRAAGLLIIGLALPKAAGFLLEVLQSDGVRGLRHGHPDAVLGYVAKVVEAVFRSGVLEGLWSLLFLGLGIAMLRMRLGRVQGIIRILERR